MKIIIDCAGLTERKVLRKFANRKKEMKREKTREGNRVNILILGELNHSFSFHLFLAGMSLTPTITWHHNINTLLIVRLWSPAVRVPTGAVRPS